MKPTKLSQIWPELERAARAGGAVHIGASPLDDEHVAVFEEWIAASRHASMQWMEKNVATRKDPLSRFPWARSVVVILVPYSSERPAAEGDALSNHVSRYALGDDYHDVVERILEGLEPVLGEARSWRYVDTGPFSDRSYAVQAGLGWIGRNGMLIHETDGSWFFIGTLFTELEADISAAAVADRCGSCTRCIEACPTDAILPNRTIDAARCISHTTIELRGELPPAAAARLAGNAFGCDICQEVCPWNGAPLPSHPAFEPRSSYAATPLTDLLRFSQADFSALFRRSAIKRAKLSGMQRNIAALLASDEGA